MLLAQTVAGARGGPALNSPFPHCLCVPTVSSSGTNGLSVPADCSGATTSTLPDSPAQRRTSDEAPAPEVRLPRQGAQCARDPSGFAEHADCHPLPAGSAFLGLLSCVRADEVQGGLSTAVREGATGRDLPRGPALPESSVAWPRGPGRHSSSRHTDH